MIYPHIIRLRGPWDLEAADATGGRWSLRRRFNAPSGISTGETVWLVLDEVQVTVDVILNTEPVASGVGPLARWECDLTTRLALHNILQLDFSSIADKGQSPIAGRRELPSNFISAVRLEIRLNR